jgi:hypothetical protein
MLSFLMIGVGGSGGETVRYTMREIDRELRRIGWRGPLPRAWQFMHVDVRQKPDDLKASMPAHLNDRLRHVPLTEYPLTFLQVAAELDTNPELLSGLAGWWPDKSVAQTKIYDGAGQRRVVGRIAGLARMKVIERHLQDALSTLQSGEAREELDVLARLLEVPPLPAEAAPGRVVVVSSLGGGSGSGTFLDVVQYLRASAAGATNAWIADPMTVLYTPDVFEAGNESERKGVEGNSLAALSELLAAYLPGAEDPMPESQAVLLANAGGARALAGNVGPGTTLLVGRKNGKVDLAQAGAVYQSVARCLASFACSPDVQAKFEAFIGSNWAVASAGLKLPLMQAGRPGVASSLGFASVGLGRTLFAEYAAERLANRALFRLRYGYLENVTGQPGRPETLIAQKADWYETNVFLPGTGLWELGRDRNQVVDALRGDGLTARLDKLRSEFLSKQLSSAERSAAEWRQAFATAFQGVAEPFLKNEAETRAERAQTWVKQVQVQLRDETVRSISRNGLDVTMELLSRLDTQVQEAAKELQLESESHAQRARGFLGSVAATFSKLTGRAARRLVGDPEDATFTESATLHRNALSDQVEVDVRLLAVSLLKDVSANLIPGVVQMMESLASTLDTDLERPETKTAVNQWSREAVGAHLHPTPNDHLLDDVDTFPEAFEHLLCAAFEAPLNEALSEAVETLLVGGWKSSSAPEGGEQTLVSTVDNYVPSVPGLWANGLPRKATFRATLTADELLVRARQWVTEATGPVKLYVEQTLSDWLSGADDGGSGKDALRVARGPRFTAAFRTALLEARPLISVNTNVLQKVHTTVDLGMSLATTPIPVADNRGKVRDAVVAALTEAGVAPSRVSDYFGASARDSIDMVTFLGSPAHPIVFDSMTTMLQTAWTKRPDEFWDSRRARPLPSFIPLDPDVQRTLVRGWMTARLLNLFSELGSSWEEAPLTLWSPEGVKKFPRRLLRTFRQADGLLPAVLESLPLAMIAFANGHETDLDPYLELIRLGSEGQPALLPGGSPSDAMSAWIRTGKTQPPSKGTRKAPTPLADVAGPTGKDPKGRVESLSRSLENTLDMIETLDAVTVTAATLRELPPLFEIRDLLRAAAQDLLRVVADAEEAGIDGSRSGPAV